MVLTRNNRRRGCVALLIGSDAVYPVRRQGVGVDSSVYRTHVRVRMWHQHFEQQQDYFICSFFFFFLQQAFWGLRVSGTRNSPPCRPLRSALSMPVRYIGAVSGGIRIVNVGVKVSACWRCNAPTMTKMAFYLSTTRCVSCWRAWSTDTELYEGPNICVLRHRKGVYFHTKEYMDPLPHRTSGSTGDSIVPVDGRNKCGV